MFAFDVLWEYSLKKYIFNYLRKTGLHLDFKKCIEYINNKKKI